MKRHLLSFAIATLVAAAPLLAQPGPGHHGRHQGGPPTYDTAAETTIVGTIDELVAQDCPCGGLHLRLKLPEDVLEVALGPAAYVNEQGVELAPGDEIQVIGAKAEPGARAEFLARELKKGDATVSLRDAEGKPLWAKEGSACPMHRRGAAKG